VRDYFEVTHYNHSITEITDANDLFQYHEVTDYTHCNASFKVTVVYYAAQMK
jgi:hypothetical protein